MKTIFTSYRRTDDASAALIAKAIDNGCPDCEVFRDVESIRPAAPFPESIVPVLIEGGRFPDPVTR